MSARPIAAYSFVSWARQGLGIQIREDDLDATVDRRGSIGVALRLSGERVGGEQFTEDLPARSVELYGPGDIIGIDAGAIVRSEPRHWTTNFETNYIPFVEFYEEDYPWRYTPAKPSADGQRLRPWLALVVLEDEEIVREGPAGSGRPLPFVEVDAADQKFPPADQLWAWAHVHVNGGFSVDRTDRSAVAEQLESTVRDNRDLAYSRLLCPRILKPNAGYHALLVPTFETGRLAGLGRDPDAAPFATQGGWGPYAGREIEEGSLFPYYHRWRFRTSTLGDFEYLVRLLRPQTVKPLVGRREVDLREPGTNLPPIGELGGVLRLGGALRAPLSTLSEQDLHEHERHEVWGAPYPHAFQTAMASLVNLADDYRTQGARSANDASGIAGVAGSEDPLIVPPLYGRWHSETQRLEPADGDPGRSHWVHELNLDPRHRVAAGFGTEIVQRNQEAYMEASWQQVGRVLEANERIRLAQMAKLASLIWHRRDLAAIQAASPARFLSLAGPVQARVVVDGLTLLHHVRTSALPGAAVSKTFRQLRRPRARIDRLSPFDARSAGDDLLPRMNLEDGHPEKVTAAPPKAVGAALITGEALAERHGSSRLARFALTVMSYTQWGVALLVLLVVLIVLMLLVLPAAVAAGAGLALAAAAAWTYRRLGAARTAAVLDAQTRTPRSVDDMPASPDFRVRAPVEAAAPTRRRGEDSRDAARFKTALRSAYAIDEAEHGIDPPSRRPVDIAALSAASHKRLDPAVTIPDRVMSGVHIPPRIAGQLPSQDFDEIMVYPQIDQPMYEPLKDLSSEAFVPNIQLIENNSITLLETNQKFIEAYMVGLNHEFARELLWREFPTDQRGSYFRLFWDASGFLIDPALDAEARRERVLDIPELHDWLLDSGLGDHDLRELQGDKEDEVVLVIRGELLKKYPTAVIYAHRAAWERTGGGAIDRTKPRRLADLTEAQAPNPPRGIVKTPLYEAKVDPDIYFFGFDLTAAAARGGQTVEGEEDPGWFFVIKERPGEPRFGLDLPSAGTETHAVQTWNDLAWTDVLDDVAAGRFLRPGEKTVTLSDPGAASPAKEQHDEDKSFVWRAETHAAELAYILYQVPVLIAVHAVEMLKGAD